MPVSLRLLSAIFFTLDVLCWLGLDGLLRRGAPAGLRWWRAGLAAFMVLQIAILFIIPGSIILHVQAPSFLHVGRIPGSLFFLWHFLMLPATSLLLLGLSAARAIRHLLGRPPGMDGGSSDPGRRRFLGMALAGPAATAALTGAALYQLSRFRVRPMLLEVTGLPPALDGLRIAHVSDLHVGRLTHGDILDDLVDQTNALKADLVLVTGDLIDHHLTDLPTALDVVGRLEGKYGVFVCEGNHDLFESGDRFRAACLLAPGTATYLFQDEKTIRIADQPVQILGLNWCGPDEEWIRNEVRDIARRRNPDAFPILLAHHPHAFDTAEAEGFPLVLSGHTHGGQLMLTDTLGWGPLIFRYWSGIYRKGRSRLVVSNGVGNWFPLRVGAEAEIIHLTLRAV